MPPVHQLCIALATTAAFAATGGAGCDGDPADVCPSDLPQACPDPAPSFAEQIEPIVEARCFPCHTFGGEADAAHDFSTYDHIFAQRSSMLNQVFACNMPPAPAPQLDEEQRLLLLTWMVCGAPDN